MSAVADDRRQLVHAPDDVPAEDVPFEEPRLRVVQHVSHDDGVGVVAQDEVLQQLQLLVRIVAADGEIIALEADGGYGEPRREQASGDLGIDVLETHALSEGEGIAEERDPEGPRGFSMENAGPRKPSAFVTWSTSLCFPK